jgi:hypothetical protein
MTVFESIALFLQQVKRLFQKKTPGSVVPDPAEVTFTTVTVDAQFSQAQKQEIEDAMGVIFLLFGGTNKFYAATRIPQVSFIFPEKLSCSPQNAVSCYVGNGVIEMTAAAFNPEPLVRGWYIAHEVGHAFDFSCSGGKPMCYRSQAFVENFVPKNWFQRLLGLPFCNVKSNIGYQGSDWTDIATTTGASIRGRLNSAEDFAETFAVIYALAVLHEVLPYRSFHSQWRYDEVLRMIQGNG